MNNQFGHVQNAPMCQPTMGLDGLRNVLSPGRISVPKTQAIMEVWNRVNSAMADLRSCVDEIYQPPAACVGNGAVPQPPPAVTPPVNEMLRDLPKMLEELRMQINAEAIRIRNLNAGE